MEGQIGALLFLATLLRLGLELGDLVSCWMFDFDPSYHLFSFFIGQTYKIYLHDFVPNSQYISSPFVQVPVQFK